MTDQSQIDALAALLPTMQGVVAAQVQATQQTRAAILAAIATELAGLSDTQLLNLAEAAGNIEDAVTSISAVIGVPPGFFASMEQRSIVRSMIATRLQAARPLARAGNYRWFY